MKQQTKQELLNTVNKLLEGNTKLREQVKKLDREMNAKLQNAIDTESMLTKQINDLRSVVEGKKEVIKEYEKWIDVRSADCAVFAEKNRELNKIIEEMRKKELMQEKGVSHLICAMKNLNDSKNI